MLFLLTSRETPTAMATMATTMLAALLRAPRLTWILRPLEKVPEFFVIKKVPFRVLWHNWISMISPPWQGFTYPFLPSLLIKSETIQFSFFFVEPACWQKRGGRDSKLSMTDVSKYWICRSNMVAKCITQPTCFLRLLISLFLSQKFTAGYYSLQSAPWEEKLRRNFPD